MYKIICSLPGISRIDGSLVELEMSYSECIERFGRETFKLMLCGDVEHFEAYPINEEAA